MDFLFCIPVIFGCTTKIKPDPDQHPRICPRCHNGKLYSVCSILIVSFLTPPSPAAVFSAKSRNWFELCFVPLVPMSSKHVWMCSICQWQVPLQQGWEPPAANAGYQHPGQGFGGGPMQGQQYPPQHQAGYQPTYLNQQK